MILDEEAKAITPPRGFVAGFCKYTHGACDGPVIFSLGTALAVLGSVADPEMVLTEFIDPVPSNYWTLLVGPSSSRKTTIGNAGVHSILQEVDPQRIGYNPESEAALLESISQNQQQLFYFGEYGTFLTNAKSGRYKDAVKTSFGDLWTGHRVSKESLKGGRIEIERPRVSKLACVAPGLLEQNSTEEDWSGGYFTRFLVLAGRRTRKLDYTDIYRDVELMKVLRVYLEELAGTPAGPPDGLDPDARILYKVWSDYWDQMALAHPGRWMEGVYGRLDGLCLRTAMLLSLDFGNAHNARGGPWRIGLEEMQYAILIVQAHLKSVASVIDGLASNPYERDRRNVFDAIGVDRVDEREIMQRLKPALKQRHLQEMLSSLVAEGRLFPGSDPNPVTGSLRPTWGISLPGPSGLVTLQGIENGQGFMREGGDV